MTADALRSTPAARLTVVSGQGGKEPACFLVETPHARLLLDLGYGPRPGLLPDVSRVGRVDALLLSHGHRDHAGGLALLDQVGRPPVYATPSVARRLPQDGVVRTLPLAGAFELLGIRIETGRNGHAPGGIWMRFAAGEGLLYMGDYSLESPVYAADAPPPAGTVIVDASYGADDTAMSGCRAALDPVLALSQVLLPVPADGRGSELALYAARTRRHDIGIDAAMRDVLRRLAVEDAASVHPGLADALAQLAEEAGDEDHGGIVLACNADGTSGAASRLIAQCERAAAPAIVFTGYLPPGTPAERLVRQGRALYRRWNVHPRLSDNAALVRSVGAKQVVAAFGDPGQWDALERAFAPARLARSAELPL